MDKELLQLRDPSHPLLVKMRQKAPWTYYHSLIVWEVASYVCNHFNNASPLLTLVWAKFHDIWKMIEPYAYAENQEDWEYPFMPEIIKTHVSRWADIWRAYKLPEEVIRFIITHHWTIPPPTEWWKKWTSYDLSEKPVSIEETLVMLADSCEAAVRWFKWDFTKDNLRKIIQKIFLTKEEQDQLRSSVLISWDFKQAEDDFVDSFYFIYHRRFATENKWLTDKWFLVKTVY